MKWFKHDTDASIDAKLQELLLDYGAAGYGLYWYCVELIAQGIGESNITFELEHDARIIARNLNLTVQETKDMMRKMVELDLFSISKNDKLACYALAKRLDKSMTGNVQFREMIEKIKSNHDNYPKCHDSVMTHHDLVSPEEKRREEIRQEEKGDNAREEFDLFWSAYPKKVAKDDAFKMWQKKKNKPPIEEILKSVEQYKLSKAVQDGYVSNPSTWINKGRWADEHEPYRPKQSSGSMGDKVDRVLGQSRIEPVQDAEVCSE